MKKGQIVEGIVQRMDFPNKGVVETQDGDICIVKNALPGQTVRCSVNKVRKGKAEGRLLDVLEPSPVETGSPCPHFGECGGCLYLSFPYEEQLKIKEMQVKKLLDQVLCRQESYEFEGIKASPTCYGYRNKMEFSFGDEIKDGPLSLGMHKRGSFYDVVYVKECQIVDDDYRKILSCVREYFHKLREDGVDVSFYHRLRHVGYLRHLLVRKAARTGEILIALVTTTQVPGELEAQILDGFKKALLGLSLDGQITGILHTKNDSLADVVKSDETEILYGQDYFYEELLGLKFKISQFSFFQTNSRGAEVLYQTARDYISDYIKTSQNENAQPDKVVFDLYSGTGTIAQLMAPVAKKVIGVEIVEEAVEAAKKNAELNGLHNCKFIAGDVLKVIDEIEEKPDIIILDPPRDGIHPKALDKIIRYGVEQILYISCKPTSLVRDLEVFLERGYKIERAVAVDQFPWTGNVETVVQLSQRKPDDVIEVDLDISELDLTASEAKATYQQIKQYVLEKYGFKVSSLYVAQIKQKCGLDMRLNYNFPKSENPKKVTCPKDKEDAIMDALKHFKMI
ncbi:MAG: 23S rRNA (uracil(1939)-C(5))-methyltransferase RlmD [Lachnospiraceae bacterium]|nr:23S rRNA (uracil(1939)-C(5))-methyltransferase RlmD [Lachnospiraceae bacterium]